MSNCEICEKCEVTLNEIKIPQIEMEACTTRPNLRVCDCCKGKISKCKSTEEGIKSILCENHIIHQAEPSQ